MTVFGAQKAIDRLEDRLAKLEDTCADLQRERRKLDLEFTELYDKVSRQMSRMAKRYAVDQKENGEQLLEQEPDDGLDPISRSIMLRRGMPRGKP
jgi:chromosome segregation ATPase